MRISTTFETLGHYVFCLNFVKNNKDLVCNVYAAQSEPVPAGADGVEERFNLIDADGAIVESFDKAFELFKVESFVFGPESEEPLTVDRMSFQVQFNGEYFMSMHEFDALYELIYETIQPAFVRITNGVPLDNEAEFTE